MAIRLYPPLLDGVLPAFYKENGTLIIDIPFTVNNAVSRAEISDIKLRLKTIESSTSICVVSAHSFSLEDGIAHYRIKQYANDFNVGQFYKAQLSFTSMDGIDGYFSTVGIIKYVAKPSIKIDGFVQNTVNNFLSSFIGVYQQDINEGDISEKVYSYRFDIWDSNDKLVLTTNERIHNTSNDTENDSSADVWNLDTTIIDEKVYYIQYTVTTLNALTISSPKYSIRRSRSVPFDKKLIITPINNFEEGYIEIALEGEKNVYYTGKYLLMRGSSQDNYFQWQEIARFAFNAEIPAGVSVRDFTVEQGITYKYALQQYNDYGVYSQREESDEVYADFEDMFIYDGTRQLKVRFNPKVASFKKDIPEQKIETIGSKYPYIFRNGNVNYKEFPIAGLISYQLDNALLFLQDEEIDEAHIMDTEKFRGSTVYDKGYMKFPQVSIHEDMKLVNNNELVPASQVNTIEYLANKFNINISEFNDIMVNLDDPHLIKKAFTKWYDNNTASSEAEQVALLNKLNNILEYNENGAKTITFNGSPIIREHRNLTSDNMMSERYFKLKVLDWLTDGRVKLFRSPGEGNYLVRLLNVSLSPIDSLGRMLHNFTCTAYEIADITYENLVLYNILHVADTSLTVSHFSSSKVPVDIPEDADRISIADNVSGFILKDFMPGDIVYITIEGEDEPIEVTIGATGYLDYTYESRQIINVSYLPNQDKNLNRVDATIEVFYTGPATSKFDMITATMNRTQIAYPIFGDGVTNLMKEHYIHNNLDKLTLNTPWFNTKIIDDAYKTQLVGIDILQLHKRILLPIYKISDDKNFMTPFSMPWSNFEIIQLDNGEVEERFLMDKQDYEYNTIDAFAMFEIFEYQNNNWVETGQYYDTNPYLQPEERFTDIYDPSINITYERIGVKTGEALQQEYKITLDTDDEKTYYNIDIPKSLIINNGIMAEITCELLVSDYLYETTNREVAQKKEEYNLAKENDDPNTLDKWKDFLNASYDNYLITVKARYG